MLVGNFTVKEATYGTNNAIVSFWATFEQHCSGQVTNIPGLRGRMRYNANPDVVITAPQNVMVTRGNVLNFTITATANSFADVNMTAEGLPGGATLTNVAKSTAVLNWTPSSSQIGNYTVTIHGDDGFGTADSNIQIAITPLNGVTSLRLNSVPGDSIGQGQQQFFTSEDGSFTASYDMCRTASVTFDQNDASANYLLAFANPGLGNLAIGSYSNGLSVSGNGEACFGGSSGSFQIKQIVYGFTNNIIALCATFEQHCNGDSGTLSGEIRFNAELPVALQAPLTNFVVVGETLQFTITATDIASNIDTLTVTGLPDGATFQDNGDNTGTVLWTPKATDVGGFSLDFRAENDAGEFDTSSTEITVAPSVLTLYSVQKDKGFFQENAGLARQIPGSQPFEVWIISNCQQMESQTRGRSCFFQRKRTHCHSGWMDNRWVLANYLATSPPSMRRSQVGHTYSRWLRPKVVAW